MPKLMIIITNEQRDALVQYSLDNFRDPRAQALKIITEKLQEEGYLKKKAPRFPTAESQEDSE